MWIEIVRLAFNGEVSTRPELTKHIMQWFEDRASDNAPAESAIRDKISLLYKTLKWSER